MLVFVCQRCKKYTVHRDCSSLAAIQADCISYTTFEDQQAKRPSPSVDIDLVPEIDPNSSPSDQQTSIDEFSVGPFRRDNEENPRTRAISETSNFDSEFAIKPTHPVLVTSSQSLPSFSVPQFEEPMKPLFSASHGSQSERGLSPVSSTTSLIPLSFI